jgi:A/G-specific adenine glycosylase
VSAIATVRHVFTHFSLDLKVVPRAEPAGEGWWQPLDQLEHSGLPTLYRKAAALVASARAPLEAMATRP